MSNNSKERIFIWFNYRRLRRTPKSNSVTMVDGDQLEGNWTLEQQIGQQLGEWAGVIRESLIEYSDSMINMAIGLLMVLALMIFIATFDFTQNITQETMLNIAIEWCSVAKKMFEVRAQIQEWSGSPSD